MGNRFTVLSATPCLPLLETTGDTSIFDAEWIKAIQNILTTFRDQQRRDGRGSYHFQRVTERALDTMTNDGWAIR